MIRPRYESYLLATLAIVVALNGVERMSLGLLLQNIKLDLSLSDTQLGLLTGLAFAVFFSLMGIPIARWADRGNRVQIISLATALWGVAMALFAAAGSFAQLLLARIGMAVGEAGCNPTALSLIADHFTRAQRARAVARFMLGTPLSALVGYFLAGWLNELYGWRMTFMLLGLPSVALAALVRFSLKDPRCHTQDATRLQASAQSKAQGSQSSQAPPGMKEVCATLWANKSFRHLVFYFSVTSFFGQGISQWQPAFFMRSFEMRTGELGMWMTLISGLGSFLGLYMGGELASRYATYQEGLQLRVLAILSCMLIIVKAAIYFASNQYLAFALAGLNFVGVTASSGPILATIQTLVPERMRAVSFVVVFFFASLIGTGLGPLAAGALSDALQPVFGKESLRYALLALCPGYLWAAWHLWRASKTVITDLDATQSAQPHAKDPIPHSVQNSARTSKERSCVQYQAHRHS
jgi:MFS transporter, Spinster family, sphingosine-1-phosphate transporter